MSTLAKKISSLGLDLAALSHEGDALHRAQAFRDVAAAVATINQDMALYYGKAVSDLVAERGPSRTARELGLSRQRIYQIVEQAKGR